MDYVHEVKRKHGTFIKVLINNNDGEYLNFNLQEFLNKKGIRIQLTELSSPKQNPVSERGNRLTSEKARMLLFTSNLPTKFWGEAVNRIDNGKIIKSHDVIFDEYVFPGPPVEENSHEDLTQYSNNNDVTNIIDYEHFSQIESPHSNDDSNSVNVINTPDIPVPKLGWDYKLKSNKAPKYASAEINESNILSSKIQANMAIHSLNSSSKNPISWKEAMSLPDKLLWVEAFKNKLNNLISRGVIIKTNLPKGRKLVGNSVQFKRKFDSNGKLIKNKIFICEQGFSQKHGVNYNDTFSPIGKFNSLQCLLSIAAHKNLEIHHMDSVAAFLNPKLEEEIYIKIPNFLLAHSSVKVWQVRKPLYGLKQSSQYWYLELTKFLESIRIFPSKADHFLFISDEFRWEFFVHIPCR
ncbi:hypothetical protein O181_060800 [Austropuccinia psidii MF-1]|uniref:Reverse transcriptase Ty1/copia-type domain-containing protein n=1 Tax=Austropuccinia psidii MF-1 TaxID=1389203 RepID=A0A9Q3EDZ0_9BASI|nr:hypothetical protein [Austropuccinia psidii MF-1]